MGKALNPGWALVALVSAACTKPQTSTTPPTTTTVPQTSMQVMALASEDQVEWTLDLGPTSTLAGVVTVMNATPRNWDRARLEIELDGDPRVADSDNDGLPNHRDRCPFEAETIDGIDDDDGCPDERRVAAQPSEMEVAIRVFFRAGSSKIERPNEPLLSDVVATLDQAPSILRLEVGGHAARGEPSGDALALARARAVQQALIDRGVDPSRLTVKGYAADQPLANDERDRRVQFTVVGRAKPGTSLGEERPLAPALPAPRGLAQTATGQRTFTSPDPVTAEAGRQLTATLVRAPIDAREIVAWWPGEDQMWRAVHVLNSTRYHLPKGQLDIRIQGASGGRAMFYGLEPGEHAVVPFATAGPTTMYTSRADRGEQQRVVLIERGFALVERTSTLATHYQNDGSARAFVIHAKRQTAVPLDLPRDAFDAGDAWWIPIEANGNVEILETQPSRRWVNLLTAMPEEIELLASERTLPPPLAKSLRDVATARRSVDAAPPASTDYYHARGVLRTALGSVAYRAAAP